MRSAIYSPSSAWAFLPGTGLFQASLGLLDGAGETARLAIQLAAAQPALVELLLHHAALVFETAPLPKLVLASNPVALLFE